MSGLLSDPMVVLAVGERGDPLEHLQTAVTGGSATELHRVETVDAALAELDERDDVGCVSVLEHPDDSLTGACERIRSVAPRVPVLVSPDRIDDATASAIAALGDCRYLPRTASPDETRAAVDDALATAARRREAALESSMLESLLERLDRGLFAKDLEGRYVRTAAVTDSPDPETLLGKTDIEVYGDNSPSVAQEGVEDDLRVAREGASIHDKVTHYTGPGFEYWTETTKVPWHGPDGEVRGIVGLAIDVSERETTARELERERNRLDRFASYVSHDLRTPLQISTGGVDRVRAGDETGLDVIESANERIAQILDDLRAITSGEEAASLSDDAVQVLEDSAPVTDLRAMVENVWGAVRRDEATLELAFPDGTVVAARGEILRPVLENLLKNAVDHGGSDVTVRVGTSPTGFFVADDGPGIRETDRERVTERGYTTADDEFGSGTGLRIVREAVEGQQWELRIGDSRAGGARFDVLDCPVVEPAAVDAGEPVSIGENSDVGQVATAGTAENGPATDRWTVVGDGTDIWQETEEFHFAYARTAAPVRIEARIAAFDPVDEYSKAGLMVRESLESGCPSGYVGTTRDHGSELIYRSNAGPETMNRQYGSLGGAFDWYRVDLVDGRLTWSVSRDGVDWRPLDQRPIPVGTDPLAGLVVCSRSEDATCEATFADVTVRTLERSDRT